MKRIILTLFAIVTFTGLIGQNNELDFNRSIINPIVNGQPSGKSFKETREILCIITKKTIQINNFSEDGNTLEFKIKKRELNSAGTEIIECKKDSVDYKIMIIPDRSVMIITSSKEIITLQKTKLDD